ncbi:hypothetical protein NLJ89_g11965 [Agrocybe chaxingu]|uniref:Uncharacterized protein n=1 Tax=Agrocybe chaxingu TaxID=84603 RepID=A0A9W8MQP7_9AGAR|nr:hypothetical protein NLJ89_g11965 [Agrocybe chaxingu]
MEKLPKEEKEKEYGLDELLNERGFRLVNYHTGDGALAFVDSEGLNVGLTLVEGSFKVEFPRISYHPLWPRYFDVLMPRLTSLRLKLTNPSLDTSFFFYLRVPGLQTLRLEKFDDYAGWDFSMFDPFMMHFTRTLRVLKLADFSPEVAGYAPPVRKRTQTRLREELERLFTILPHLEVLRLPSSIQVYDSTIEKLMNGLLLPPLTELELYTVNAEQTLWMVKGRNFLSEYYRLQPGSSRRASEVVSRMNVERFRLVKLWVDDCEVESVRVASQMLAPASTLSIGSCRL